MKQRTYLPISFFLLTLSAALLAGCGSLGSGVSPDDYLHINPSEYYLYPPLAYTPETQWPVFIGIHGAGGSGRDCWNQWQRYADEEGFILLCPSLADPSGGWFQIDGEQKLNAILRAVHDEYSIINHYFLTGFSAGAQFVESYGFKYPKWAAGVSMMSAGNFFEPESQARSVPYLVIVGGKETDRLENTKTFVGWLKNSGYTVSFHIIPDAGHTITEEARNLTVEFFRQYKP
jgi:predicted esterase